jgi:hypothetical protein
MDAKTAAVKAKINVIRNMTPSPPNTTRDLERAKDEIEFAVSMGKRHVITNILFASTVTELKRLGYKVDEGHGVECVILW